MDKVLDKLGIYDLVAVLLSGVCALGTTYVSDELIFHFGLSRYINPENTAIFLILSYLIGTTLQELGSALTRNATNKNSKLLQQALDVNHTNHQYISKTELEQINALVQTKLKLDNTPDIDVLYNFCKHCGGNSPQTDKDQSIAAFSRSISLHFFILSISVILYALVMTQYRFLIVGSLILLLSFIFWSRCIRFYKLRYVKIIRQYYYIYLRQSEANSSSNTL